MKILHKLAFSFICIIAVCGLFFGGCGNPYENMSIAVTSESFDSLGGNQYHLTLTMQQSVSEDEIDTNMADVTATIEGAPEGILDTVEWIYNRNLLNITYNDMGKNSVTISGLDKTLSSTKIIVRSTETDTISAEIWVDVIVPATAVALQDSVKTLGIPVAQDYMLAPQDIFTFTPTNATIPNYTYVILGVEYNSDDFINIATRPTNGIVDILAYPTGDAENEALKIVLQNIRVYSPLTNENTIISDNTALAIDVENVELRKGISYSSNKAILYLTTPDNEDVSINVSYQGGNVDNSSANAIQEFGVSINETTKTISLQGYQSADDPITLKITISIKGVSGATTLTKNIKVKVVDYATKVLINSDSSNQDYALKIYDKYKNGSQGESVALSLAPYSRSYNNISLTVAYDAGAQYMPALSDKILINGNPFTGEYNCKSGDTIYLKNDNAVGKIMLLVTATDTLNLSAEYLVQRRLSLSLEHGVSTIGLDASYFDNKGVLNLQYDEYGAVSPFATTKIAYTVLPAGADVASVTATATGNGEIINLIQDKTDGSLLISAVSTGISKVTLTADSGATNSFDVNVISLLNTYTIGINTAGQTEKLGTVVYRDVTMSNGQKVQTLDYAYASSNAGSSPLKLTNTAYPASAQSRIAKVEYTSSNTNRASAVDYNRKSAFLQTYNSGSAIITVTVTYYKMTVGSRALVEDSFEVNFEVIVYTPISHIEVNYTEIELLSTLSSTNVTSVYDINNTSAELKVSVFPANAMTSATSAVWVITENADRLQITNSISNYAVGHKIGISTKPVNNNLWVTRCTAKIQVSITDINGIRFTKTISVIIKPITRIAETFVDNYSSTGVYFELYKQNSSFPLNISYTPADATNTNIEFLLFDASLNQLSSKKTLVPHNREGDIIYDDQLACKTIEVVYDEELGKYKIIPIASGYAVLYLVPQDILPMRAEAVTNTSILQTISKYSSIKKLEITVADGYRVYYELYTADDVANVGSEQGLDKNYYLMNTIDMSSYLLRNEWKPIGSATTPFTGLITSYGCDTLNPINGAIPQSVVGWSFDLNDAKITTQYFGIFGVLAGANISGINFYFNSYTITQLNPNILWNYDFGILAGRIQQGTQLSNVSVNCNNFIYNFNTNLENTRLINLGAIANVLDVNSQIVDFKSIINANINSNNVAINFGTVAGSNTGNIGSNEIDDYSIFAQVNLVCEDLYYNVSKLSNIGAVVGSNKGVVSGVSADGKIQLNNNCNANIGGIVGKTFGQSDTNRAEISNALSSVVLVGAGNLGGIVGYSLYSNLEQVYYEIYNLPTTNFGLYGVGNLGGIAGVMASGSINYAITQAYNLVAEANIQVGQSSNFGGLVGMTTTGRVSINNAFVNLTIQDNSTSLSGNIGGLLGSVNISTDITDCYTRGSILSTFANCGGLIGILPNQPTITLSLTTVYADMPIIHGAEKIYNAIASKQGVLVATNVVVLYTDTNAGESYDINYESKDTMYANVSVWNSYAFNGDAWNIDINEQINDGLPFLMKDGNPFVRIVPKSISLTAKSVHLTKLDNLGNIKPVQVVTNKNLILDYNSCEREYKILDLYDFSSDPSINLSELRFTILCSNNSVVQVLNGGSIQNCTLKIISTGIALIKVINNQNNNAKDIIQLCVINGFTNYKVYNDIEQNLTTLMDEEDNNTIRVKQGKNLQISTQYLNNEANTINQIDGGLKLIVDSEDYFTLGHDWIDNGDGTFYNYIANSKSIVLVSLQKTNTNIPLTFVPFFVGEFYNVDYETLTYSELQKVYLDLSVTPSFNGLDVGLNIYQGPSKIAVSIADNTKISAGNILEFDVTLTTDDYDALSGITPISFELYKGTELISTSSQISVQQGEILESSNGEYIVLPLKIWLSNAMRDSIAQDTQFTIHLFATSNSSIDTTLTWYFVPATINYISLAHFSDAINTTNRLEQAGEIATNTIIAGEFGLLRIKVAPQFAYYDRLEVLGEYTNGERVTFDQRVLRTEGETKYYMSWQDGVYSVENGLALAKVTDVYGTSTFNGTYYVRTRLSNQQPQGAVFTVLVKLYNGNTLLRTESLNLTVYRVDELSMNYYNYSSKTSLGYLAVNTGYQNASTPKQNHNQLEINVSPNYSSYSLSVNEYENATIYTDTSGSVTKHYIRVNNSAVVGDEFVVTLIGYQDVSGYVRQIVREMRFKVVDFYMNSLDKGVVGGLDMGSTITFAYIKDKIYDLNLFKGVNADNLASCTAFSFDTTNATIRDKILAIVAQINGINSTGDTPYSTWYVDNGEGSSASATYTSSSSTNKFLLQDNYYLFNDIGLSGSYTGYRVAPIGVSNNSLVYAVASFYYDANGSFNLCDKNDSLSLFTMVTNRMTLNFYQTTSQEHPEPIYNLSQLLGMQANRDYILMNDITINNSNTISWTPINTVINSLDGNGYKIFFNTSFSALTSTSATFANYGLFGTINELTVIKNLNIVIVNSLTLDVPNSEFVNFGILAGTNYGTIYNCCVSASATNTYGFTISTPSSTSAIYRIGGLVGYNAIDSNLQKGSITNSRVTQIYLNGWGKIGGLVSYNDGNISSSYFASGTITNNATTSGDFTATAGLVATNAENGVIWGSFTGGSYSIMNNGIINLDTTKLTLRDGKLYSGVNSAGFVYDNEGSITDCYSAMRIYSNISSGFVFNNTTTATITRAYSTSYLTMLNSETISRLNTPFIGVSSTSATANNNLNLDNGITDCYYYNYGFSSGALLYEESVPLSQDSFCNNTNTANNFNNFAFSSTGEDDQEFGGVWVFANENNKYFNQVISNTNFGPKLVSASLIATPRLVLDEENTNVNDDTGEIEYSYAYYNGNPHTFTSIDGTTGIYTYEPIVVTNAEQFNNCFENNEVNSAIRLAKDIDLTDLETNFIELNSKYTNFSGILEGNNYTIQNVNITVTPSQGYGDKIGLFAEISASLVDGKYCIGTVNNLTLSVASVTASLVSKVGALAGEINNGSLSNIKVLGQFTRVVGQNIVGGVAGAVYGATRLQNITSDIGATAVYNQNKNILYNLDFYQALEQNLTNANPIAQLGYAGGLFGVIDLTPSSQEYTISSIDDCLARNLISTGNASIVAKVAGGLFGLIGHNTVINNAIKEIDKTSIIKGYVFAGGISGENHGIIRYSKAKYTDSIESLRESAKSGAVTKDCNTTIFQNSNSLIGIGGITGLNIGLLVNGWQGGNLYYTSSSIDVKSTNALNAGGLIGLTFGGELRAVFATGSVLGMSTANIGGLIGNVSDLSQCVSLEISNPIPTAQSLMLNMDYCIAFNNWTASNYNYYQNLANTEVLGEIGSLIGYCYDVSKLITTHTEGSDDPEEEYNYLANRINFGVSQINNRELANTVLVEQTTNTINLQSIGKVVHNGNLDLATLHTRGWMIANYQTMFAGWDSFSIKEYTAQGTPVINNGIVPELVHIKTHNDLLSMYWHTDTDYILDNDIDFMGEDNRIKAVYYPAGSASDAFTGYFAGQGHKISNLVIFNTSTHNVGLFGVTQNATIDAVTLENINYSTNFAENSTTSVGGLVGKATNTIITNCNIISTNTNNSVIKTNATYLGGLVGQLQGSSEIVESFVDVNLITDDYELYTTEKSVYIGGLIGFANGEIINTVRQISITNVGAQGEIENNCSSTNVRYNIGGAFGSVRQANVTGAIANVKITVNNLKRNNFVAGFAGNIFNSNISQALSANDLIANITSNFNNVYIAGFVAKENAYSTYTNASTSTNIILSGNNNDESTNSAVAGFVAMAEFSATAHPYINESYSVATIYNQTLYKNTDSFCGIDLPAESCNNVVFDKYLSLDTNDRLNCGIETNNLAGRLSNANYNRSFIYPKLRLVFVNNLIGTMFDALWEEGCKLNPINIDSLTKFNNTNFETEFNYYRQDGNLSNISICDSLGGRTSYNLNGVYNGAGNNITIDNNYSTMSGEYLSSTNWGVFGELYGSNADRSYGSTIMGVRMQNISADLQLKSNANFGFIAGVLNQNCIAFANLVTGQSNFAVSSNIDEYARIGGIVGTNHGNVYNCASYLNISLAGEGKVYLGQLIGESNTLVGRAMHTANASGTIQSTNTNYESVIGALIGVVVAYDELSGDELSLILNSGSSYTNVIINAPNNISGTVVGKITGGNTVTDIYYDQLLPMDIKWTQYDFISQRNNGTLANALGDAYQWSNNYNYGLPRLNEFADLLAIDTGNGDALNPYQIPNAQNLIWALTNTTANKYYTLTNDIEYSDLIALGYNPNSTTFVGHLLGNKHYIVGSTGSLVQTIATNASISLLGFRDVIGSVNNIVATNIYGTVNKLQILANTGTVSYTANSNMINCRSTGATFADSAEQCYNTTITELQPGMDGTVWVFNGTEFVLFDWLNDVTQQVFTNPLNSSISSYVMDINISNATEYAQAVAYINDTSNIDGATAYNLVPTATSVTLDFGGQYLPKITRNVTVNINAGFIFTNVVVTSNETTGAFITKGNIFGLTLTNAGIVLKGNNATILGDNNQVENQFNINNVFVYVSTTNPTALLYNTNDNTANITATLTNVDIVITNTTMFNGLININNGTANLTANNTTIQLASNATIFNGLVNTNNGTLTLNVNTFEVIFDTNEFYGLIKTNAGTLTINADNYNIDKASYVNLYPILYQNNAEKTATLTLANCSWIGARNVAPVYSNNGILNATMTSCTITGESQVAGLLLINAGTVNAYLTSCTLLADYMFAGVVMSNNLTGILNVDMDNCVVGEESNDTSNQVGGIVYENEGIINTIVGETMTNNSVYAYEQVGGIANYNSGTINVNLNSLTVAGNNNVGGLVCTNVASLTANIEGTLSITAEATASVVVISEHESDITINGTGAIVIACRNVTAGLSSMVQADAKVDFNIDGVNIVITSEQNYNTWYNGTASSQSTITATDMTVTINGSISYPEPTIPEEGEGAGP